MSRHPRPKKTVGDLDTVLRNSGIKMHVPKHEEEYVAQMETILSGMAKIKLEIDGLRKKIDDILGDAGHA